MTSAGNYEWVATTQPDDRKTYFESLYDDGNSLLRGTAETGFWGMTADKAPRKARKGERQYYEFIHTLISSKRRYPIAMLFQKNNDGTSFDELLDNKTDVEGLLSAFAQAGKFKNVQVDGNWETVEQPVENWEATIDLLLTVTEKDGRYTQTCHPDKFIRTGYVAGITRMEAQNAKRPFILDRPESNRKVHYTIQPEDFTNIPF